MRKLLCVFLVMFSLVGKTQTLNTFYMIPPTSGCNGVWALDVSPIQGPCGPIASYLMDPCHDVLNATFSGDTLFLPLCSLPCNFNCVTINGCVFVCDLSLTQISNENYLSNNIQIYPNPTTDELKIENGKLKIENVAVYNVIGEPVLSFSCRRRSLEDEAINVSSLTPGIYFIRIKTENGIVISKFVKQ